jgi:hypothetical protein
MNALSARCALALVALAPACSRSLTTPSPEPTIVAHPVVLDASGELLAWPRASSPYAHVAGLAWGFMKRVPVQPNGLPTFYAHSRFDPDTYEGISWPHNPAGLAAMLVDSASLWHAFSGDREVVDLVARLADYQLAHGTTPDDGEWPRVPYASAAPGATEYGGADDAWCDHCGRGDGLGVIEPDKVGELGLGYLRLWMLTGDARYRDAALACADALVKHVRAGDDTHSPWPFRVVAATGFVRDDYCANVLGSIMLMDELLRLELGDADALRRARDLAWSWMMEHPMNDDAWSGYFEDITIQDAPGDNPNQYTPMQIAKYLMEHPERDPEWPAHVRHILSFVEKTFGGNENNERGTQFGAMVVSEQRADMAKMASHTARYAAVSAMLFERTGDDALRERAFRSLNWATYACDDRGVVAVGPDKVEGWWFSDGYGDYIRHFLVAMAAVPEWAPAREDHVLRSSSIVTRVAYGDVIAYSTFDAATDVLRVRARPARIEAGGAVLEERADLGDRDGYTIAPLGADWVVRVRHAAHDVRVVR